MSTTTITGTINGVNNTALANKWITFRLVQLGTDSGATATVGQSVDSVQTDANGDFSIDVWNNGDSGKISVLEITVDGSKAESVIIPTGTTTIELWDLIENYQADNGTSEQLPVVSELFLRKSNNLSDISNKLLARQNLDLEIGVDVQSYSAVLDATTASFTTAKDTAISTNTTEIATNVTDIATNVTNIATNVTNIATNATNIDLKSPIDNPTFTGTINTSATGIDFNPGTVGNGGELLWNASEKTLDLVTGADGTTIQVGQEVVLYCRNKTGVDFTDGQIVKIVGATSNTPNIELAIASTVDEAHKTFGVVTQTITANNGEGFITLMGKVRDLSLRTQDGFVLGELVYLSATVAGALTSTKPLIEVEIGRVLRIGTTTGTLGVSINNEASVYELQQELSPLIGANTIAIATKIPNDLTTGTADATTFLRGDNTWSIPVSGNTAVEYPYTTDFQSGVSQTRDLSVLTPASGYQGNANLTSLYIGSKITEIGFDSVQSSANLLDVTIPNSVTLIGDSSFLGCTGLLEIVIPNSVLDIQSYAFVGCTSLASATIGASVAQILDEAFKDCTLLGSVSSLNPVAPALTATAGSGVFFNILATTIDVPIGATGYGTTYGGLTVNYVL